MTGGITKVILKHGMSTVMLIESLFWGIAYCSHLEAWENKSSIHALMPYGGNSEINIFW